MYSRLNLSMMTLAGLLLSGCSLFSGHQTAHSDLERGADLATARSIAEIQLEVGRENLAEGNLARAAQYLRGALNHPETRPDAANALGVVYVRLGRLDVAQRYFGQAAALAPNHAKYSTNLARIERDLSFARLQVQDESLTAPARMAPTGSQERASARIPETRAQRSGNLIRISTAARDYAPAQMEIVERRPVVQAIEQAEGFESAEDKEIKVSQAKTVEYPIRVEL